MLENKAEQPVTDQGGLQLCCSYFAKLYQVGPPTLAQTKASTRARSCISNRLFVEMKESLKAPIIMAELDQAVKDMAPKKAPGPDGVITEFFKVFWDLIKWDYLSMINDAIAGNSCH